MTEAPLIEMRNATVWRGSTRALHRFSLSIGQHERVAILGPNGAGKTTLLKTITRELRHAPDDDSRVSILGRERWNVWELRKHIGLVSHELQAEFTPYASVFDVVVSGFFSSIGLDDRLRARVRPRHREQTQEIMRELEIDVLADRAYRDLSTGQQRRCLLGRALIHDPHTLIFDEPTAGLDLAATFDFLARVRQWARNGRSLVWVTHHLNDIPPEVERVIILKNGEIVSDGSKASVLTAECLSDVYETNLRVTEVDGHILAYPGAA
ncbi:ABC transporter ATP-binding protein [Elongatibacter sediminis]|uniref:ATP-binding cassette domain-containing protein n=1 Tax=Elongatibacter sediminis TaxID=3119006 RepID=A0AAW9RBZ2_9GAMM